MGEIPEMIRGLAVLVLLLGVGLMSNGNAHGATEGGPLVFISSFVGGDEGAVQAFQLDTAAGALKLVHRTPGIEHPFFLAISPNHRFLYSIQAKEFGGAEHEFVAAYLIDHSTGGLRCLNRQSTHGASSCYLELDGSGKTLLVANYDTGSVAAFPVQEDGSLREAASFFQHAGSSVDKERQEGPHAHSFVISPDNRHAYAADLGLDQILGYRLDAAHAKLTPNQQPFVRTIPGAGPRHLTFHPNGKHLYAINELANSVTLFDYDSKSGMLIERQTISTVPEGFKGTSHTADLKITPDGRFLYGTNRGHDSIAAYRLGEDGRLSLIEIQPSLGGGPQNLLIAADGKLLICANMAGSNVSVFRIDPQTGALTSTGAPLAVPSPSCIRLIP